MRRVGPREHDPDAGVQPSGPPPKVERRVRTRSRRADGPTCREAVSPEKQATEAIRTLRSGSTNGTGAASLR